MFKSFFTLAAVYLLTTPMAANALILYSSTGLSGTFTTENFDINAGDQTNAGNQFTDIIFGTGNYVSDSYSGSYPNMINSVISNFNPCCQDPTSFSFSFDLSELAFAFVSNPQQTQFSTFLNNVPVESTVLNTDYSGFYVNVTGITFDEVRITSSGNNDAYIIDNMQFKTAQVPDPASLALIGIGLAGLGLTRRRRRA